MDRRLLLAIVALVLGVLFAVVAVGIAIDSSRPPSTGTAQ